MCWVERRIGLWLVAGPASGSAPAAYVFDTAQATAGRLSGNRARRPDAGEPLA